MNFIVSSRGPIKGAPPLKRRLRLKCRWDVFNYNFNIFKTVGLIVQRFFHMKSAATTYELSFTVADRKVGGAEILKNVLAEIGIAQSYIVQSHENGLTTFSIFENSLTKIRKKKRAFGQLHLKQVLVSINRLRRSDWQNKWKNEFKPFHLTKKFDVVPIEYRKSYQRNRATPVFIDSGLAFGTGLHPTTRFMSQFIERCSGRIESFLDIGTGSGILTIIALYGGVKEAIAVDCRRDSVINARKNMRSNGFDSVILKNMDFRKLKIKQRFDFVAANLITFDLIEMGKMIIDRVKPNKFLALSGVSLKNYHKFREAYSRYPLRVLKIEKKEGWVGILYKKIPR